MKRIVFFVLVCIVFGAGLLKSEIVYLKDGSIVKGTLKKISADTLYFETSFGSMMKIPKHKIFKVDFADGAAGPTTVPPAVAGLGTASAEPGSLMVVFDRIKLTSRITVKRDRDREGHERENAIEVALMIDGKKVYSFIDSTTDKLIANGPEKTLRNDIEPRGFTVGLPAGLSQGSLHIGNTRADEYADRFDPEPLNRVLILNNLDIKSNETLVVQVGMKKKMMGLKKTELIRSP